MFSSHRFIADVMVGRLANWLRILGYDVLYDNHAEDRQLVETAAREDRIILTRDTRLVQRKAARRALLIRSDHVDEQLRQVLDELDIQATPGLFTRCLRCNTPLESMARDQAKDYVPVYVYETQERFSRCLRCQKIYWAGTHRRHVQDVLERVRRERSG